MIDTQDREYVKKLRQMEAGRKAAETRRLNKRREAGSDPTPAPKPSLVKPSPIYVPPPEPVLLIPPVPDLWKTVYRIRTDDRLLALQACRQFAAEWGNGAAIVEDSNSYFDTARFRFESRSPVVYYRAFTAVDADGDRNRFYHFEALPPERVY